jgi:NAD(P)-dependent dehydrogenase (short-subunit alcohol dehydrogenase family)
VHHLLGPGREVDASGVDREGRAEPFEGNELRDVGYVTPVGHGVLVTGATSGIGLEASVTLAREGHLVVMVGRDEQKTLKCVAEVKQRSGATTVEHLLCDFASQASIRALAAAYRAKYDRLDVLVNNAGLVSNERTVTKDGIETTFAVNHLGYFLLTNLLLDLVVKSAPSRIVVVSSTGHYGGTMDLDDLGYEKGGYSIMGAYRRSKLGNVMMTRSLAKQLEGKGVTVNALHPGGVATNIWTGAPGWAQPLLTIVKALFLITPEQGGKTLTFLATSPEVEGKTGLYFEKNKAKECAAIAKDEGLAQKLWVKSAELVKL